jgi:hypothetical protein
VLELDFKIQYPGQQCLYGVRRWQMAAPRNFIFEIQPRERVYTSGHWAENLRRAGESGDNWAAELA